jgi:hypothetical protein
VEDFGGTVLGRKIEILQADDQNKPDVASGIARQWIDDTGVDALADGSATSSGLGVQQIAKEKQRIYLICDPAATDFIGKLCTPWSFQFAYDTYALANATGGMLTKSGGSTWFFITADYEFGYSLQKNTETFIAAAGGKVLGAVRAPLATSDFSTYLLQAKASGAKVIGLANAGTDLQNCIKQAAEFQLTQGGVRLATLLMAITDVNSLGLETAQGLVLSDSFYWDATEKTRAWTKRFSAGPDAPPDHAAGGVLRWRVALPEGGKCRGQYGNVGRRGQDACDAGQRLLQHRRAHRSERVCAAQDVCLAGEDAGRVEAHVGFLQAGGDARRQGCVSSAGHVRVHADGDVRQAGIGERRRVWVRIVRRSASGHARK